MARLLCSTECLGSFEQLPYYKPKTVSRNICKLISLDTKSAKSEGIKANQRGFNYCVKMCSISSNSCSETLHQPRADRKSKQVWIWTESKQVMTAAVERGWNTFIFSPEDRELAIEWSCKTERKIEILSGKRWRLVLNEESKRVAKIFEVSSPQELQQVEPENEQAENVIVQLIDWQIIPAENIVAAFQGSQKTLFAISKTPLEARVFLETLEQGLGGVVLKVENVEAVLELKDYFEKINEAKAVLSLTKVTITDLQAVGMGDRVCVDLCSLMKPGEGLLVGSFARGLVLVHSECLESKYISSRPFRVNAGPVYAYLSVPGRKTCYLSELKAGKEVIVTDQKGQMRTAIVGRVKIETRPLILVEAKREDDETCYSIFLQNAETVALVPPYQGNEMQKTVVPVTSLNVGDEVSDVIARRSSTYRNRDSGIHHGILTMQHLSGSCNGIRIIEIKMSEK